jgi:NADH:ubiquinone oxidoreductase subunit 3 (subunit A)
MLKNKTKARDVDIDKQHIHEMKMNIKETQGYLLIIAFVTFDLCFLFIRYAIKLYDKTLIHFNISSMCFIILIMITQQFFCKFDLN